MRPVSLCALTLLAPAAAADPGDVLSQVKISATSGGFGGAPLSEFGSAVALLEDLDGDGIRELAVGEPFDADGGSPRGAVWILFLNADGSVRDEQKISDTQGGLGEPIADGDEFGYSVASLGDIDGDGIGDVAVGAPRDDTGGSERGAVWILRLNTDGTVKSWQKVSDGLGLMSGRLDDFDRFGRSVALVGDLDGDGRPTLAVGAPFDDDGALVEDRGAVYMLELTFSGHLDEVRKISDTVGGFPGPLDDYDWFGSSLAPLGDVDGDGIEDLAVGAMRDDDGGTNRGAVWVLFLGMVGHVKSAQKISSTSGGFAGALVDFDEFGRSVAAVGDLDQDGSPELAVGVPRDSVVGSDRGAVWILFLDTSGQVVAHERIDGATPGLGAGLQDFDVFGSAVAALDDFDGDGKLDLAVGALGDDDGGPNAGAVYLLSLDGIAAASASHVTCPSLPGDSLTFGGGPPVQGTTFLLHPSNPLGTQGAGALTLLLVSRASQPLGTCGLVVPGYGMTGPGAAGAFVIDLLPPNYLTTIVGPVWGGPATTATIAIPIPTDPSLNGFEFFGQGLLVDPSSAVFYGLTEGIRARIGA